MNDDWQLALGDTLDFLRALQRDGIRPRKAQSLLQAVRGRHPQLTLDLLSEEQAYDQSVHYDVLLSRAGEGTVSLSYCPERALPWPLRGVHRWDEGDLVSVGAHVLSVDQAMACLDFIWDEAPIIERLVNMCLVQAELDREPITLSDAEVQQAMDQFRAAKKLFKAEDTLRWLERHGMSHEKLERYVTEQTQVAKLRERIAGDRVESYFAEHERDFDSARIARLDVADQVQADALANDIRSGAQDFFQVAEHCYFERAEQGDPPRQDLFDMVFRRDAEPALRESLFSAEPGQLIGPVPVEQGYTLVRVSQIIPAQLDDRVVTTIKKLLFDAWLAERRQTAHIEWRWGNASQTG